jgi:hypothetical protein
MTLNAASIYIVVKDLEWETVFSSALARMVFDNQNPIVPV